MLAKITDDIVKKVTLDIVVDELELDIEPEEVDLAADLADVYEADSLGLIQVLARVNKELSIRLPREEASDLRTVDALVRRIIEIRDAEGAGDVD